MTGAIFYETTRRSSHLRVLATTCESITRTLGAGLISGVCEVIDPVGTVPEKCVLGLEDEKRRFLKIVGKLPAAAL